MITMRIGFWECLFLEIETPFEISAGFSPKKGCHSSTQANPSLDA